MEKRKLEVNAKLLLGIFSLGIILVLPLRAYQYLTVIESGTGFYEKSNFSVPLLYLLLGIFCGAMFLFALIQKKTIFYSDSRRKRPALGVMSLFAAVTLIIDAVIQSRDFSALYFGPQQNSDYEVIINSATSGLMKSGMLPMLLEAVFAVLAALFFTVLGLGFFNGKSNGSEYKLLAVTPLAWSICRILHRFMRTISFMKVSDLFFELLMLVLLMVFFMAFAQLIARVNQNGVDWKIAGFGLPAAMFCLLCFIPRAAMLIMGKGSFLADQSPPEYCDFAIALFIVAFLISKTHISGRKKQV